MASLKNIYEISKTNYTSVENNSIYLFKVAKGEATTTIRDDIVNVDVNTAGWVITSSTSFVPNGTYFVEGWNDYIYGTVNFGIINLNTEANSSSKPIVTFGVNTTSTTLTTASVVRLEMYYSGSGSSWYVRVSTAGSYSSFTAVSTYNLTFRRVYI